MHLPLFPHANNPVIIQSLAWNAVRESLVNLGKWELLTHIEFVKITPTRITIKTGKPIVNTELLNHAEAIKKRIEESFGTFGVAKSERKIVFL